MSADKVIGTAQIRNRYIKNAIRTGRKNTPRSSGRHSKENRRTYGEFCRTDSFFRLAFLEAPVGMCILDSGGRFLFVNKRLCQITGFPQRKLLAKCFSDLTHPDDLDDSISLYRDLVEGITNSCEHEKRYIRADGTIIWVLIRISLVQDDSNLRQTVAQIVDITARKQAEAALHESRQLIDRILDTSTNMIWVNDSECRFLMVNRAFADFMGISKDNIIGKSSGDVYRFPDKAALDQPVDREVIRSGKTISAELPCTRPDGEKAWWHTIKSPIMQSDGVTNILSIAMDITERKRAEKALESANAYNRSLIEASLDPLVTIGQDGSITDVNAATEQATGFNRDELIGKDFSEFFTDPEAARIGYLYVFREGQVRDYPLEIRHRDGRTTPVLYNASVFRDICGKVIGVFAAARDVTERRKAEQEIIRLNAKLEQRVLERTSQLAEALDESRRRQGEITALLCASRAVLENRAFQGAARAIFNSCAELIGASAYICLESDDETNNDVVVMESGGLTCEVDPQLPIPVRGLRGEAYRTGRPVFHNSFADSEWKQLMPAGHIRLDNVLFSPLLIKNRVVGLLGLANREGGFDIRHAQTATAFCEIAAIALQNSRSMELLENSEERFRSVAQSATDAIISINENGDICFWNDAAENIFKYKAEDVLGNPLDMIIPEIYREEHRQKIKHAVSTGETHIIGKVVEVKGIREDGSEFPLSLSLSTWRTREGVFFTGIMRDDTERKKAEESIIRLNEDLERRAVQLEAANCELEAFAYSVSHDLRAPLRSIDGFSQALLEDCHDSLDDQGKNYLRRVRSASQRMAHLIDDILKLSRITRSEMYYEEVDLSALVSSIAEELRAGAPERRVEFSIREVPPAWGDSTLLRTAMQNLLDNSWKFTGTHETAKIVFGMLTEEGKTVYFVRDDGAGFDMNYADKLFAPFHRLHKFEEFTGTGIGLSIVQRVIRRHGGEIWAEGAVEKGATFYFTLQ